MTTHKIIFTPRDNRYILDDKVLPQPANKHIPQWFKQMPHYAAKENGEDFAFSKLRNSTSKRCPSFNEVFSNGFVVVAPCDIYLKIDKDGTYTWKTPSNIYEIDYHADWQFKDHYPDENIKGVFKINYPYIAITPKGYGVMQLPMLYHHNTDFYVPYGYLETDIYHEINQQLIITTPKIHEGILIKQGTPLNYLIPYKKDKWETKFIKQSKKYQEMHRNMSYKLSSKFSGGFFKNIKR